MYFRVLLLLIFPLCLTAQQGPQVFIDNERSGIKDINGDITVPAIYSQLGWSDGMDLFVDNVIGYFEGNWGIISAKNRKITAPDYYELWPVHKDLIIASRKGKFSNHLFYGALNSKGEAVVDFKYASINKIVDLLIVSEEREGSKYYGLLNEKNQFLLNTEYNKIKHFADDTYIFSDFEWKSGLIKTNGEIIVPLSLDSIGGLVKGKAKIFRSGKVGLLNEKGQKLVAPNFKKVTPHERTAELVKFSSFTIVDKSNQIEGKFDCDSLIKVSPHFYAIYRNDHTTITNKNFEKLYAGTAVHVINGIHNKLVFTKNEKYGVLNDNGSFFKSIQYDSIYVDEGYFYLKQNGSWSILNKFGRAISKNKFDEVKPVSESLIAVKRRGYWGFVDFQGDLVIGHKFDDVTPFKFLTSKVRFLDGFGTINQFGEWICQPVYDDIIVHKEGVAQAKSKSRTDLVNHQGEVVFQTYNQLRPYDGGFIEETAEGKIGFIMRDGQIVKHPVFDEISFTSKDSILIARDDNYLSLATKDGNRFYSLSGRFEEVIGISEGFVGIKLDGKYGFVDLQGNLRIANRYDSVKLFSDGMAAFYLRGNWGYIDKQERLKVQPIFDSSEDFFDGNAIVLEDGKYGVIDKDGNYILSTQYEGITRSEFGTFIIESKGKTGIVDIEGRNIASTDYSEIKQVAHDQIVVKRRGMYGVMNEQGRFIIPMMYSNISLLSQDKYLVVKHNDDILTEEL